MKNSKNTSAVSSSNQKNLNENNISISKANQNDFFIDNIIKYLEDVKPSDWEHFFNHKASLEIVPMNPHTHIHLIITQ